MASGRPVGPDPAPVSPLAEGGWMDIQAVARRLQGEPAISLGSRSLGHRQNILQTFVGRLGLAELLSFLST